MTVQQRETRRMMNCCFKLHDTVQVQPLALDSQLLGLSIAKLTWLDYTDTASIMALADDLQQLAARGFQSVYLRVESRAEVANRLAQTCGGQLCAQQVELQRREQIGRSLYTGLTQPRIQQQPAFTITECGYSADQLPEALLQLASLFLPHSHLFRDLQLPPAGITAIYRTWISNAVAGRAAKRVLIAHKISTQLAPQEAEPVGLITLDWQRVETIAQAEQTAQVAAEGPIGEIGLLAVSPCEQGQHLGSALLDSGLVWLQQQGCQVVQLTTQCDNQPALRLYASRQFTAIQHYNYYHFHLKHGI